MTHHWATPIYRSNLKDPALVQSTLELARELTSVHPTVEEYGTASVFDDLITVEQSATAIALRDAIQHHLDIYLSPMAPVLNQHPLDYVTKLQLCILNSGEVTGYHGHDYSFLTGIVYLSPQTTGLILHDPRINAARGFPQQLSQQFANVTIVPEPGDIVIFPSFVYHSTMVHNGTDPRVVIPFNAIHK